ncbi:MAG: ATP-binding cassette domain-containing protein [Limimaricola sp.]|uniref:ABC transporter ATP-binding protein n=1 Tax=Limimaricola sp. TaxID=2211665 RepID=UPI001DBCB7B9|nr:ABC transporter ATP-binding protein [Limimaricola sp.]MBI1418165.1 ATP-binding cassette domain-containing protein [Limimaricola sp.]
MKPDTQVSPIVRCRGVTKVYRVGAVDVPALSGIDLDLAPGDFATLAGPSGSGKTTLLNMIGGLDRPTSGTVEIDGQEVTALSSGARAALRLHRIGFVFQAYNLVPVLSALENVALTLQLLGVGPAERAERARVALDEVGIGALADRRPAYLSGGQQQRVAVARALVTRPVIVLADEPTANLDSTNADGLIGLMSDLNRASGTTFLISSHDARVIDRSRRHIEVVDGKVVSDDRR